jgi:hypothetical protein
MTLVSSFNAIISLETGKLILNSSWTLLSTYGNYIARHRNYRLVMDILYLFFIIACYVFFFFCIICCNVIMAINVEMTLCCNEDYFTYLFILTHKLNNTDE